MGGSKINSHTRYVGNYGSIDIVIPYMLQPTDELYWCLRGIVHFMTSVRDIYIIGDKPSFEGPYIHIPETDRGRSKQDNIRIKIETACGHPDISDPFLFMNDDYFLTQPMDATKVKAAYNKTIWQAYLDYRFKKGAYKQALKNTVDLLGADRKHYDIHYPILYHKKGFINCMRHASWHDWSKKDGFVIKTLYCMASVSGPCRWGDFQMEDPKLKQACDTTGQVHELVKDLPMFSTDENSYNSTVAQYLARLYDNVAGAAGQII